MTPNDRSTGKTLHDLRIEQGWENQREWVFVWCPCGWKTEVTYIIAHNPIAELKRAFHEHLRPPGSQDA